MGDFGIQIWTGDLDSYFENCRRLNAADRARWSEEREGEPPCKHGNPRYVDGILAACPGCRAEEVA